MLRRAVCLLLVLALCAVSSAFGEEYTASRWDFRFTFRMDGDAFPPAYRLRARGYASLVNRLSLDGSVTWCMETESLDLNATLYFTDKPDISIAFRLYGFPGRLYFTSPLLGGETVLLNMAAFLEFTVKARNTLGIDMPWLAFLYPYCTQSSFGGIVDAWNLVVGTASGNGVVSVEKLQKLSDVWEDMLQNDSSLIRWISALGSLSAYPTLVEQEFFSLPDYLFYHVCGGNPLSFEVDDRSETWRDSAGRTLYSRISSGAASSVSLTLPSTENGYDPSFSLESSRDESSRSFRLDAFYGKDGSESEEIPGPAPEAKTPFAGDSEDASEEEGWWDEDVQATMPDRALAVFAAGENLPLALPADSEFALDFSMTGALYPNFALKLLGSTKKDGRLAVSVCKPFEEAAEPVVILRCEGDLLPAAPDSVPDFRNQGVEGCHNAFSFNEITLAEFRSKVTSPLVRGLLSFIAEAPARACQSLLDDLTDLNILGFILEQ